jgi:topoisomerase-4 subunit B
VSNALSQRCEVTVYRDGQKHTIAFEGGELKQKLKSEKSRSPRTGTVVRLWPDRSISTRRTSRRRARAPGALQGIPAAGLTTVLRIEGKEDKSWKYERGMTQYFDFMLQGARWLRRFSPASAISTRRRRRISPRSRPARARPGRSAGCRRRHFADSHVNLIPTRSGGTHEAGFRNGIFEALVAFMETRQLTPKGVKLIADDLWSRACFTLSARIVRTQFHGQTKEKLTTRTRRSSGAVRDAMRSTVAQPARGRGQEDRRARDRAGDGAPVARQEIRAQEVERRRDAARQAVDCAADDTSRNELFLVEGDSAGGSAKEARNKDTQAVLPLRGKVLNTMSKDARTVLANKELQAIATAIGVDPHGADDRRT